MITSRRAMWILLAIHAVLLAVSIPDYRVSIDSGYHVSLARYYAEHGTAFWDHINFGPGGRPNLQGPALHYAIAIIGKLLGGAGDAFVLANAILAFLQWAAAVLTVVYFARLYASDSAALFAVALISGSAFASYSFAVGIPSGWTFILAPWAIHFFLKDRLVLAALATALAIYFHIASYAVVPFGIVVAALIVRRWRALLIVGAATVVITLPYTIHFLGNLAWYQGRKGHTAAEFTPLIYLAAVGGLVPLLRWPRKHVFLVAWLAAPAAWLIQDYTRFLMQATLAMSVIGGVWLASLAQRMRGRWRSAFATAVVLVATLAPLSIPSLAGEALWAAGIHYPRLLDWNEARDIAGVITRAGLTNRLVAPYSATQCIRFAVYAPLTFQKGHWVEVQPKYDPADDLSAGVKVYILPLPPGDPVFEEFSKRGLIQVHGGALLTVATLPKAARPAEVAVDCARVLAAGARWLSEHAVNNRMAPVSEFVSSEKLAARRRMQLEQRTHAARIEVATLIYAYALEASGDGAAKRIRGAARGFGNVANFLGDDATLDFVSDARHEIMRRNLASLADAAARFADRPADFTELGAAMRRLFDQLFTAA